MPYPLPENALHDAIERLHKAEQKSAEVTRGKTGRNMGTVLAVQSLCGGAGGTNFAVNLGWELCQPVQGASKRSAFWISISNPGRSQPTWTWRAPKKCMNCCRKPIPWMPTPFSRRLQVFQEKMHVLTAPSDMLPLDLLSPEEIERVIAMAQAHFDYVIIDLPRAVMHWTETVLNMSDLFWPCWNWTCGRRRTRCAWFAR